MSAKKAVKKAVKKAAKKTATKKTRVLFLHSAGPQGAHQGSSDLLAYLKKGLGSGYRFIAPKMPRPQAPDYAAWKAKLAGFLPALKGDAILIGHSLGGSVLLKYLSEEKVKTRIPALFLAATPYWGEKGWEYEVFHLKDGFEKRLPAIPEIFLYHSRKDGVVPFGHLKRYAEKLKQGKVRALKGDSHAFEGGMPEMLADLKTIIG